MKNTPRYKIFTSKKCALTLFSIFGSLLIAAGLYLLLLVTAPSPYSPIALFYPPKKPPVLPAERQLYIPKIGVNIVFDSGKVAVLDHEAWWRFPERGNPIIGGNFILSAHRFNLGFLPGETKIKSPFYNLNRLEPGDNVYIDYLHVRYKYQVVRRFSVKPTELSIEDPSAEAKLTLYSCTLRGQADGREVVQATLIVKNLKPGQVLN